MVIVMEWCLHSYKGDSKASRVELTSLMQTWQLRESSTTIGNRISTGIPAPKRRIDFAITASSSSSRGPGDIDERSTEGKVKKDGDG